MSWSLCIFQQASFCSLKLRFFHDLVYTFQIIKAFAFVEFLETLNTVLFVLSKTVCKDPHKHVHIVCTGIPAQASTGGK